MSGRFTPPAAHNRFASICGGSGWLSNDRVECRAFSACIKGIPPTVSAGGSLITPVSCATPVPIMLIINTPTYRHRPIVCFPLAESAYPLSIQARCLSGASWP